MGRCSSKLDFSTKKGRYENPHSVETKFGVNNVSNEDIINTIQNSAIIEVKPLEKVLLLLHTNNTSPLSINTPLVIVNHASCVLDKMNINATENSVVDKSRIFAKLSSPKLPQSTSTVKSTDEPTSDISLPIVSKLANSISISSANDEDNSLESLPTAAPKLMPRVRSGAATGLRSISATAMNTASIDSSICPRSINSVNNKEEPFILSRPVLMDRSQSLINESQSVESRITLTNNSDLDDDITHSRSLFYPTSMLRMGAYSAPILITRTTSRFNSKANAAVTSLFNSTPIQSSNNDNEIIRQQPVSNNRIALVVIGSPETCPRTTLALLKSVNMSDSDPI